MNYLELEFKKSTRKGKKYMARWKNKPGSNPWVHFGALGYEQWKDSTPLGLYSDQDHGDDKRRDNWYSRHRKNIDKGTERVTSEGVLTPAFLSARFLW